MSGHGGDAVLRIFKKSMPFLKSKLAILGIKDPPEADFIAKARNDENTKEKINFVLSNFRVFVINSSWLEPVRVGPRYQIFHAKVAC